MINLKKFEFNGFQENTYIISDETLDCIIVDPGCSNEQETNALKEYIDENKLKPAYILNTHCHIDHILGVNDLKKVYSIDFIAHKNEIQFVENAPHHALMFGLSVSPVSKIDITLENELTYKFGNSTFQLIHVPGHSPGSLSFYFENNKILLTGDALFHSSIGRSDLPGGNHDELIQNIKSKLLSLPDETEVYPGHGPSTTIRYEKTHNPFLV